jgi:transcriptional regulator GlxA family with amidase domain
VEVTIPIYDRFNALDVIGPYEVLRHLPDTRVVLVAAEPGPISTEDGAVTLLAEHSLSEAPAPDVVLVPGGAGEATVREGGPIMDWLVEVNKTSEYTASVCTGALILAAAGLLTGRRATTYWLALDQLSSLGAEAVRERFVFDGKFATSAGVSAGIDMSLALAARIAGDAVAQTIQLAIEYDPQPPFDAGSEFSAPAASVEWLRKRSRF